MTSHIHRGFHRIGVVLAVLPLLVAAWITCDELWQAWSTSGQPPLRMLNADGTETLLADFYTHHAYFGYALAWAGLALALYAAARAVGWVVAGFVGSGQP